MGDQSPRLKSLSVAIAEMVAKILVHFNKFQTGIRRLFISGICVPLFFVYDPRTRLGNQIEEFTITVAIYYGMVLVAAWVYGGFEKTSSKKELTYWDAVRDLMEAMRELEKRIDDNQDVDTAITEEIHSLRDRIDDLEQE